MMTVEQLREVKAAMCRCIDDMTEGNLALVGNLLLQIQDMRHGFNRAMVENNKLDKRVRELENKLAALAGQIERDKAAALVPARNPHLVSCLE